MIPIYRWYKQSLFGDIKKDLFTICHEDLVSCVYNYKVTGEVMFNFTINNNKFLLHYNNQISDERYYYYDLDSVINGRTDKSLLSILITENYIEMAIKHQAYLGKDMTELKNVAPRVKLKLYKVPHVTDDMLIKLILDCVVNCRVDKEALLTYFDHNYATKGNKIEKFLSNLKAAVE